KQDVAVKVVAARVRGPFEPDERREVARIVELLRRVNSLLPSGPICARPRKWEPLRHSSLPETDDDIYRRIGAMARLDLVVPLPALRCGQQLLIAAHQLREEPEAVGVIRHDEEVEWPGQLGRLAVRSGDLLAPGETISIPWSKSATEGARVHRKRSVQVRVAEERPCRKISARVGRVWRLVRERFFCGRFVERTGIRWHLLLSLCSQPDHASGQSRA